MDGDELIDGIKCMHSYRGQDKVLMDNYIRPYLQNIILFD